MAYTVDATTANVGYIRASTPAGLFNLQSWTWAFWAKRTGTGTQNTSIVASGLSSGSNGDRDLIITTGNKLAIYVKTSNGASDFGNAATTMSTDWQFYVMSYQFSRTPQV